MVDAGREARFVEEHVDELGLVGEMRVETLDGVEALKAGHPLEAREEYRRHPAARELGDQLEAIEPFASRGSLERGQGRGLSSVGSRSPVLQHKFAGAAFQKRPLRPTAPPPGSGVKVPIGVGVFSAECDHRVKKMPMTPVAAPSPAVTPMSTFVRS